MTQRRGEEDKIPENGGSRQDAPPGQREEEIDEAVDETFPASDPPESYHVD